MNSLYDSCAGLFTAAAQQIVDGASNLSIESVGDHARFDAKQQIHCAEYIVEPVLRYARGIVDDLGNGHGQHQTKVDRALDEEIPLRACTRVGLLDCRMATTPSEISDGARVAQNADYQ